MLPTQKPRRVLIPADTRRLIEDHVRLIRDELLQAEVLPRPRRVARQVMVEVAKNSGLVFREPTPANTFTLSARQTFVANKGNVLFVGFDRVDPEED